MNESESNETVTSEVEQQALLPEAPPPPQVAADELLPICEALLACQPEGVVPAKVAEVLGFSEEEVREVLLKFQARLIEMKRGVELVEVNGRFELRTAQRLTPILAQFRVGRPRRLSAAALETLAVIAYRQPVVKSEIEKVRGVDVTPTLKTLLERGLIAIVGHQPTVGQPALYGTTPEFLRIFGLASLSALPTLQEVKHLEREPGEEGAPAAPEGGEEPQMAVG